jgi:iron complex outermembrane receptor protein
MFRTIVATCVSLGLILGAAICAAQTNNGAVPIDEMRVISVSRQSQSLPDTQASISIIDAQELRLVAHTHYQESLNRLPGVNVHRNSGQESLVSIRSPVLTGAGACGAFLIAENGIPLRSNGFCNVNEMFDAHTENAEQIEVVRGPGSAFWGSNAMHGLINVVLPEPGEAARLRIELGPRGSYQTQGVIGFGQGNFKQTLLVSGFSEQGYRADSGVDQQKASWLYSYMTGQGIGLDGGFTHTNLNQETAGFLVGTDAFQDSLLRKTNANPEAYRDSKSFRAWTSISLHRMDWNIVLTPYWRDIDMSFMQHFLPGQPIEKFEHKSLGMQVAGYRDLDNGAQLALGLDFEFTDAGLEQTQLNPTMGSFFLVNSIPQGKHYDYDVEAQQIAAFLNYEHEIAQGWDMSLGLRLENIRYQYDNLMIDGRTDDFGIACALGCRYNRPADREDSFANLSPKIGLSYAINEKHSIQFRLQRGFRAPQATELYRLQNDQSVADLDSVELDSYELNLKGGGTHWDYSASLYFMDKQNEIFQNSARENLNNSHTQHRGLELALGYQLTDSLLAEGVFNYVRHTYESSRTSGGIDINGNDVDTAPNRFGNLRLKWQATSSIVTELEWVMMGEYFTNPENTAEYDGHSLINLRGQYQLNEEVSFSLNLMNLTNERYAERADWTTFTGDRYFPGEGLRAFFAVNWEIK